MQHCYTKFQNHYSQNDAWKVLLERWEEFEAVDQGAPSMAERTLLFNKTVSGMAEIVSYFVSYLCHPAVDIPRQNRPAASQV